MMVRVVFIFISFTLITAQDVFVTVENGVLRGTTGITYFGTPYRMFLGIPFAQPPVGELRFKAPLPASNWTGIRDATTGGAQCIELGILGSEDCLFINVFVPESLVNASSLQPVMAWIHGGGFISGDSLRFYSPDYFLDHEVIYVSFNYRTGAIGFLSLLNDDIPGNAGLKDQVLALQWIQRNIAAFNGDPDKVTIFGESGGGISSSFLMLSPAAQGLFRAAIMQSGVATVLAQQTPREHAFLLAASLGLESEDEEEVAAFLLAADAADLTRTPMQSALSEWDKRLLLTLPYGPVVEQPSDTAFITEEPATLLKEGRFNQVAVIAGTTSAEGSISLSSVLSDTLNNTAKLADLAQNFTLLIGYQLPLATEEERLEAAQEIEDFYFGERGFNTDDLQVVYDFATDFIFGYPTEAFISAVTNASSLPAYRYYWDFNGTNSIEYGMPHGGEINYMFTFVDSGPDKDPESLEGQTIQRLVTLWTNFVKYNDPAPDGSPVTWERFTAEEHNYLDMKAEFVNRRNLLQERMDFWKETVPL